jgi:mannose-6-phosphate isomerase
MMQTIFRFKPIYKERPWGGKNISKVGEHHQLPLGRVIGESWEITDREGDESIIAEGEFSGKSIRWLLDQHGTEIMGKPWSKGQRFPLLIKILDAMERMSLQVHPPSHLANELRGEPKTEMWYMLDAAPHAAVMAGLKKGVKKETFDSALKTLKLEPLIHRLPVKKGDSIFIPSGRIHAIDAGCLILEIQQNSDTTYRVYDWGRLGLDGKPRDLHVDQSLKSIDFNDFEPPLVRAKAGESETLLANCDYFKTTQMSVGKDLNINGNAFVLHVTEGDLEISNQSQKSVLAHKGQTYLLGAAEHRLIPKGKSEFILTSCK